MNLNSAFKQSQQALNNIQRKVKERLEEIQFLDKECVELDFTIEKMREDYLAEISTQNLQEGKIIASNIKLEDIAKLEEELKELSLKKVKLAEQIQAIVNQQSQELERHIISTAEQHIGKSNLEHEIRSQHMFHSGLKKHKGRQKNINPEIKAIIKEYYHEKETERTLFEPSLRKYCTCKSDKKLEHPESMIECENSHCKTGWFHFECVGISFGTIPTFWYCPKCHIEHLSDVNTITYKLDNQNVEVGVRKQEKTDEEGEREVTQIKRKRGRPRKYPVTEV